MGSRRPTVRELLDGVDGDPVRAMELLDEEMSSAKPRPTLIRALEEMVAHTGPITKAVRAHVEALRREVQLDTNGEALCAMAVNLAELLDAGDPVGMTASWNNELRQTLGELAKEAPGGRDPDAWLRAMSSEVRDTAGP